MGRISERLNSLNGAWRPFVTVGLTAMLAFISALAWRHYDLQAEMLRGQNAQNERLSTIEERDRTQDRYVDLAAMLRTVVRTEGKVTRMESQIGDLTDEMRELSTQLRRYSGQTGTP